MILSLILSLSMAHAQEHWRCTDESSEMIGNQFYSCGVAQSKWEGVAREKALMRAAYEFNTLCDLSTDCKGRHIKADPGKTTCSIIKMPRGLHWKCYRLLVFTIN